MGPLQEERGRGVAGLWPLALRPLGGERGSAGLRGGVGGSAGLLSSRGGRGASGSQPVAEPRVAAQSEAQTVAETLEGETVVVAGARLVKWPRWWFKVARPLENNIAWPDKFWQQLLKGCVLQCL